MNDCASLPKLKELNIPYYVQIYDIIYERISSGALKEGDTIPGENALAAYWNVSRSTIRLAVRKLEEDGLIYKMQGKKTTVTGQMERSRTGISQIVNPCLTGCQIFHCTCRGYEIFCEGSACCIFGNGNPGAGGRKNRHFRR